MTVNEIVEELRATRPQASDALRLQVLDATSRPVAPRPSLLDRLRGRRLLVVIPVAAGLAMTSAIAIGISRPESVREAGPATAVERAVTDPTRPSVGAAPNDAQTEADRAALKAQGSSTAPAVGPSLGRPQRFSAELALEVPDADALSDSTQEALAIVRSLGGYAVSTSFDAAAETGAATLLVRVPTAKVQDALVRLSALGTIVGQRVQIDDLGDQVSSLEQRETTLRERIARLTARLTTEELDPETRATLAARRTTAQRELADVRVQAAAVNREASLATISLALRTEEATVVPTTPSRFDRALDRTVDILAWEGIALLYAAVVAGPFLLLAAGLWVARRTQRRREDDRLLSAS
jgi:hypothetical protein